MRLANAMGLPWEEQYEEGTEEHGEFIALLLDVTCDFFKAGGSITLTEWSGFTPLERAIARDAGEMVKANHAALIGIAAQGHHANVLAIADNGKALINERLSRLLDKVEGKGTSIAGIAL